MRTVDGVDHIVVLKDGIVAEQGTPQELKAEGGQGGAYPESCLG